MKKINAQLQHLTKTSQKIFLALLFLVAFGGRAGAQSGESLFKSNCASCHTIGRGVAVGPDLKDIQNRHEEAWLLKWVRSSQAMVKEGDTSAVRLFNENNKVVMPDQTLNDAEIKSVFAYIKDFKPAKPIAAATNTGDEKQSDLFTMMGFEGYILLMLGGLLLVILWVMSLGIQMLVRGKVINH